MWGGLAEAGDVPDAHSLVHGRGDDEVFFWVEKRGHDVVRVPGKNRDAIARSAVPYANRLVVRAR